MRNQQDSAVATVGNSVWWQRVDWSAVEWSRGVAVALSGGGDSVGLALATCFRCAAIGSRAPVLLTVDHGLREASAAEATWCARFAASLGVAHHVLSWRGYRGNNLQAAARDARYALMGDWCRQHNIGTLLTGHTQDDQAETVLMRLRRGSGVDGLAAIWSRKETEGLIVARPFLNVRRKEIRDTLTRSGITWLEDPSNHNTDYERVRVRAQLREQRDDLLVERLCRSAQQMRHAVEVLEHAKQDLLTRRARLLPDGGTVALSLAGWDKEHLDTRLRALASVLAQVGSRRYRPRYPQLCRLEARLARESAFVTTLHGAQITVRGQEERRVAYLAPEARKHPPPRGGVA